MKKLMTTTLLSLVTLSSLATVTDLEERFNTIDKNYNDISGQLYKERRNSRLEKVFTAAADKILVKEHGIDILESELKVVETNEGKLNKQGLMITDRVYYVSNEVKDCRVTMTLEEPIGTRRDYVNDFVRVDSLCYTDSGKRKEVAELSYVVTF